MTIRRLLPIALTLMAAAVQGGPASVTRSVTNDIPSRPLVRLAVTAASGTLCHAYEEFLPANVTATNVTGGGLWLPDLRVIRWGLSTNTPSVELSYRMVGQQGTYIPDGRLSADGAWTCTPAEVSVYVGADGGVDYPIRPGIVAPPVITPPGGTSLPQTVTLSCATAGAVVRYTLDGTVPEANSPLYTGQITVTSAAWLRARGFGSNVFPSVVRSEYFSAAGAVSPPQVGFKVLTNTAWQPVVQLAVTQALSGLCWAYELWLPAGLTATNLTENGVFDPTNGLVRWGLLVGRTNAVLSCAVLGRAGAYSLRSRWSTDGQGGELATIAVPVTGGPDDLGVPQQPLVARPVLSPSGSGQLPVTVSVSCATTGADVRYTLDGSPPTEQSTRYTNWLTFTTDTLLRVRGFKAGLEPSPFAAGLYSRPASNVAAQVIRSITNSGTPFPSVALWVVPPPGTKCFAVAETVPDGLTPYGASHSGAWDTTNGVMRWGPFYGSDWVRLEYQLRGLPGAYRLAGAGSADGASAVTTGPDSVQLTAEAPYFLQQPGDQTVFSGDSVTLRAIAGGSGPLQYQWLRNGSSLAGAVNVSLILSNAQAADSGAYALVVTNVHGAITSAVAIVTVSHSAPFIVTAPQSQVVERGSNVTFSVLADGSKPLTYQWRKEGLALPQGTNSTLGLANVQYGDAGNYTVVVSNHYGSVTSSVATLSVLSAPQNYTITATTEAVIVLGTTDIGNHGDDTVTTITLPFAYTFYGQTFTTAALGANGNLQFGSASGAYANSCLPDSSFVNAVFPFWDDLLTEGPGGGIFTSTSGSAPSRIFNIEWRATYYSGGGALNFEVRLYEGQQRFDIIYGILDDTGSSATVGAQKDTGSMVAQYECNSGGLSNGLQLTFQMPGSSTPTRPTLGLRWSSGSPQLSISGEVGNRYALEYAPALGASNTWQSLLNQTNFVLTNSPQWFLDTSSSGAAQRYYRARPLGP